jgi:selenide, water dikinase
LLSEILAEAPLARAFPHLMVGTESCDDAAVYRINETQAIVATTDFFMPIVDDPYDFGRIAAANALSDVYAMGGRPFLALALLGVPVARMPPEVVRRIVAGGHAICEEAGIPIAGGHSIDTLEPIYGLVALGLVDPRQVKRNDGARAGDVLILGKALGVGIMSAALRKGELAGAAYAQMIESTTRLNTPGLTFAGMAGVHAMTDVTGFGLLGHLMEICRGSQLAARIRFDDLPVLAGARELAQAGYATGASDRNWAACAGEVRLPATVSDWQRKLLTDPQTSGGLLIACAPEDVERVLAVFASEGFRAARAIGTLEPAAPGIVVV